MKEIIDIYLDQFISKGLNKLPETIEREMLDTSEFNESFSVWLPIKSNVKDSDILEFEEQIGFKLPNSYKEFLKYKHFYELQIGECSFCAHPINCWRGKQIDLIYNSWPSEFLIEKGRIPFAIWSDWGLLCFDTTVTTGTDYPIVLWDHERAEFFEAKYKSFEQLIQQLHDEQRQLTPHAKK